MEKSLILYGAQEKLTRAHRPVHGQKQPAYFVRAELVNVGCVTALSRALPKPGEIVLNTVPIT